MAGCGCGSRTPLGVAGASGPVTGEMLTLLREGFRAKLAALGPADRCPDAREFVVNPRTSPAAELFTTRPGPVKGFAPDLVHTFDTSDQALEAALARYAEVGGTVVDGCVPV